VRKIGSIFVFVVAVAAQGCGGGGRPTGPPAPVPDTVRTYQGNVAYYITGPRIGQRDANGRLVPEAGFTTPTFPRPGPRFAVEVLDENDTFLSRGTTDSNGNYTIAINYGKNPAPRVRVRVLAEATISGGTTLRVLSNASAAGPYEYRSPLIVDVTSAILTTNLEIPLAQGAGAFHILDVLFEGMSAIRGGVLGSVPDLDVFWEPGNGDTSVFTRASSDLGELLVAGGITGDTTSNTDVWDEPQLMRLLGEYYLGFFSNTVAPAGAPNDALLVPSAAWREGFLDFFACVIRGTPEFWDSEGSGASGHVVRFFNAESFFDPALGSLGPDDPNVYQDPALIGIGSRFTVAEVLWDLHDSGALSTDGDALALPLFLTLRDFATIAPGQSYPYLYTALDKYVATLSLTAVQADIILAAPEDQGLHYPPASEDVWPAPVTDPARVDGTVVAPYDRTYSDRVDNVTPMPLNEEIGLTSQRYFQVRLANTATMIVTLTTTGSLRVEIMDLTNAVLASGTAGATAPSLSSGRYIVRVLPDAGPVEADFDLRIQLQP